MIQPQDPWHAYRYCRRLLFGSILAGLLVVVASFPIAKAWHTARPIYVGLAVFVLLAVWSSGSLSEVPCPKCGQPFVQDGKRRAIFTRKCLHCQHPRWS